MSGVGKKTAERLVLELKDKTGDLKGEAARPGMGSAAEVAIKALLKLGYTAAEADEAVRASLAANGRKESPELVKDALRHLAGR